jgi:FKBP-type peptidyl-prolyl cis-trans isomerase FkpA
MFCRISRFTFCAAAAALLSIGAAQLTAQEVKQGPTDKDAPKEFTKTKSGLKYKILRKTDGKRPTVSNTVTMHYRGWLDSGKEFDSSYTEGKPLTYKLGKLVKGWQEGLPLIGEGAMIELEIPSEMGYGARGFPPDIPPDATLHFIVELLKVE